MVTMETRIRENFYFVHNHNGRMVEGLLQSRECHLEDQRTTTQAATFTRGKLVFSTTKSALKVLNEEVLFGSAYLSALKHSLLIK